MNMVFSLAAIALYLVAAGQVLRHSPAATGQAGWRGALLFPSLGALLLHAGLLYQSLHTGSGINLGFFNSASLISWVVALLLLLSLRSKSLESLVLVFFPLAALAVLASWLFPGARVIGEHLGLGVRLHIVTSLFAYSLLLLAALQAVFLALQEHRLRHKRPGLVMRRLPPLQVMEQILFQMLGGGFLLLTFSLLSGVLFLEDIFAQHLVHKTFLSLTAWGIFALLLWGRWRYGWRGRTAVRWTLLGFSVLMLAYFGSKLVLELILGRV